MLLPFKGLMSTYWTVCLPSCEQHMLSSFMHITFYWFNSSWQLMSHFIKLCVSLSSATLYVFILYAYGRDMVFISRVILMTVVCVFFKEFALCIRLLSNSFAQEILWKPFDSHFHLWCLMRIYQTFSRMFDFILHSGVVPVTVAPCSSWEL